LETENYLKFGGNYMNKSSNNIKIIVIGLDGASLNIIQSLTEKNKLPFFQTLIRKGSYGNLKSSLPLNGAASWASFFSGKNPGKHNIYDFIKINGSLLNPKTITNDSIKSDLIWHIANKHSLKTILFNVPIASEPDKVNGIMVSGLATAKGQPFAYPNSIYHELLDQNFEIDSGPFWQFEPDEYINQIQQNFEMQSKIFHQMIKKHPWDMAIVTFNALNRIQQFFWEDQEKIESFYTLFDSFLQNISDSIDKNTYFVLLSNHGFKTVTKKFFVNEWLCEQRLLNKKITINQPRITNIDEILYNHKEKKELLITKLLTKAGITKKNIRLILPNLVSETMKRALPMYIRRIFKREYLDIKWDQTQAYFLSEHLQGININLKGREPHGIVEPGTKYEQLRDKIISELHHLKDPYTFEPVVEEAYRKEDIFHGEYLDSAPDIIIVPYKNNYYLDPNKRTSRLVISSAKDEYPVYGHYDRNGIFFITGPKIKQGKKISNTTICDVAPTILHLFGIENKNGMDGNVIADIFSEFDEKNLNIRPKFIPADDISSFISKDYFHKRSEASAA